MPRIAALLAALGLAVACSPTFESAPPAPTVVTPPGGAVVVPSR